MTAARVTSIVVTYHSADVIAQAMGALRESHEAGVLDCIVVDNAGGDQTVEIVRRDHGWAQVIASPRNLGYGRGCNLGLQQARTPYVLFMNPDAIVLPADLKQLVEFMEAHPKAGMVGPALIEQDGNLQVAGGLLTPGLLLRRAAGRGWPPGMRRVINPGEAPFQTDWLCGAVLLARRSLMDELAGFDPRFFLYFEETDLCRRVLAAGAELWAVGGSAVHHAGGASSKNQNGLYSNCLTEHYFRSRFYYMAKHYGYVTAVSLDLAEIVLLSAVELPRLLMGRSRGDLSTRWRAPMWRMPARES